MMGGRGPLYYNHGADFLCAGEAIHIMMHVQATDTVVSIWISREQTPADEQLRRLVCRALAEQGLAPWSGMEAECFSAGEDTLIIARPGRPGRPAFYFDDLETLLAGALANGGDGGSLYAAEDGYLLAVDGPDAGPALYEYGQAGYVTAGWEEHAAEQGRRLIPTEAARILRRYFGRQM